MKRELWISDLPYVSPRILEHLQPRAGFAGELVVFGYAEEV
jgi:hypothetical protein